MRKTARPIKGTRRGDGAGATSDGTASGRRASAARTPRVRRAPGGSHPTVDDSAPSDAAPADGGAVDRRRDKRRALILKAAVKVFAERGYHASRISDIAEEAGVAYGLVYHYFGNKDRLLAELFDSNWAFFSKAIDEIVAQQLPTRDTLLHIARLAFSAFAMAPLVVKVLVLEFGRNARLGAALENPAVTHVFRALARVFDDGQRRGEIAAEVDAQAMGVLFIGLLETTFVSFVLTQERNDRRQARARKRAAEESAADAAPARAGRKGVTLEAMEHALEALLLRGMVCDPR